MLTLLFWIVVFVVSIYILIKSADYFTDSAKEIGIMLGMSPFIVGVTIVAFGTSIPELATCTISVIKGVSEIVVSNAFGSNIANILLVVGFATVLGKNKLKIKHKISKIDLTYLGGSSLLAAFFVLNKNINIIEASILVLAYVSYIIYAINSRHKNKKEKVDVEIKPYIIILVSAIAIYFSSDYLIKSLIEISTITNIGKEIVAITAVAFGTSLPELAVSVGAAKKGDIEIAIGNVIGSNIFNALMVIGIPAIVGIIGFSGIVIQSVILTLVVPFLILATLLFFVITYDNKIKHIEGYTLLLVYTIFIFLLFWL